MTKFLIGSAATGYVPFSVLPPVSGSTYERIATSTVSLGGVTTQNVRAVKRRYNWPLCVVDNAKFVELDALFRKPGPFWLQDASAPSTTPPARRNFQEWWNETDSVRFSADAAGEVALGLNKLVSWEDAVTPNKRRLIRVTPGQTVSFGTNTRTSTGLSVGMSIGWKFYNAAGVLISSLFDADTILPGAGRHRKIIAAPAGSAYAQPYLQATGAGVVVWGNITGGPTDTISPWKSVFFEGLTVVSHTPLKHTVSIELRES